MVDLRTLLLLVAVADVMVAAVLWMGTGRRVRHGMGWWIASLVARSVAIAVLVAGLQSQASAIAVAAAVLAASMTLQAGALLAYDGRQFPAWVHIAVMAGAAVPFALLGGDAAGAVLFGGMVFGTLLVVLAAIAMQIHAPVSGRGRARSILVATFAIGAVAFYLRGVAVMLVADPMHAFVSPGSFQSALFVAAAAAAILSSFAFLLLHKERAEGEAVRMATMDPLTGAYNRRTFHEIAERELSRIRRAGQPLSIIIVDIDHFRPVNESYGVRVGDEARPHRRLEAGSLRVDRRRRAHPGLRAVIGHVRDQALRGRAARFQERREASDVVERSGLLRRRDELRRESRVRDRHPAPAAAVVLRVERDRRRGAARAARESHEKEGDRDSAGLHASPPTSSR